MNRYTGNEPIEPFHVPAKTIKCSMSADDTAGAGGFSTPPPRRTPSMLDDLDSPLGRMAIAATVLVGAYVLVHTRPAMVAITVFVLLAAVMYRLDSHRRRVAAAPIGLATAMLATEIVSAGLHPMSFFAPSSPMMPDGATTWVPLFLAACLAYAPKFPTCTEKIMMIISLIVLGSGLLPGHGFEAVFATIQYFLFIAVAVGLSVDFNENGGYRMHQAAAK